MTEGTEEREELAAEPAATDGAPAAEPEAAPPEAAPAPEHAAGVLDVPDDYGVLEGSPDGGRRGVAVVVSRFNGEITSRLLASALEELERAGAAREAVTVVPVPGAFELPLAVMALAKTRRYACIVALGCVIRGETPHFDYVAGEAASGLQQVAITESMPVIFGVLTTETEKQAHERIGGKHGHAGERAAEAAAEMIALAAKIRL